MTEVLIEHPVCIIGRFCVLRSFTLAFLKHFMIRIVLVNSRPIITGAV